MPIQPSPFTGSGRPHDGEGVSIPYMQCDVTIPHGVFSKGEAVINKAFSHGRSYNVPNVHSKFDNGIGRQLPIIG